MLFVHMLFGLVAGLTAAAVGLAWGASTAAAAVILLLGCNVGLFASALATLAGRPRRPSQRTRVQGQVLGSRCS